LRILESSYLVRKLYNYSRNPRKIESKLKKYYPYYTSLTNYVDSSVDKGRLFETECVFQTNAHYFYNIKGKEVDIVLMKGKETIGIEVKSGRFVKKRDIYPLISSNFDRKYLLISPNTQVDDKILGTDIHVKQIFKIKDIVEQLY